jgi:cell division septum initiation protein DivIVA
MTDFEPDVELDLTPPPVGAQYHPPETENVLLELRAIIDAARPVPLSASSMIAKEEVLELIDEALDHLPEELRAARWLLKEREEYLANTRHEAEEIITQARARAERMVQRTEVVKAAEARARHINEEAEANARRMRREAEDFCDQRLASFENVLSKVQKSVAMGRQRLAAPTIEESELRGFDDGDEGALPSPEHAPLFDQER